MTVLGKELKEARRKIKERISRVSSEMSSSLVSSNTLCQYQLNGILENIQCFISKFNQNVASKISNFEDSSKNYHVLTVRFGKGGYIYKTTNNVYKKVSVLDGEYYDDINDKFYKQGDFVVIEPNQPHSFKSDNCALSILFE